MFRFLDFLATAAYPLLSSDSAAFATIKPGAIRFVVRMLTSEKQFGVILHADHRQQPVVGPNVRLGAVVEAKISFADHHEAFASSGSSSRKNMHRQV